MEEVCKRYSCFLPPFCHFTPEEWAEKGHEYDEVRDCMLGWDVTDFGYGDFEKRGFTLITIRNGNRAMPDKYPKVYAEKLLYLREGQYALNHFHWFKTEDIINRGGGVLCVELYSRGENDTLGTEPVTVTCDGRKFTVPSGTVLRLMPGESITLLPGQYHAFWAEKGSGKCLLGEVSMVNDDNTDNRFYETQARFTNIEEDCPPVYLLCNEYPEAK